MLTSWHGITMFQSEATSGMLDREEMGKRKDARAVDQRVFLRPRLETRAQVSFAAADKGIEQPCDQLPLIS